MEGTFIEVFHDRFQGVFALNSAHVGLYQIGDKRVRLQLTLNTPYRLEVYIWPLNSSSLVQVEEFTIDQSDNMFRVYNPVVF